LMDGESGIETKLVLPSKNCARSTHPGSESVLKGVPVFPSAKSRRAEPVSSRVHHPTRWLGGGVQAGDCASAGRAAQRTQSPTISTLQVLLREARREEDLELADENMRPPS
jgi:hypothetical protein